MLGRRLDHHVGQRTSTGVDSSGSDVEVDTDSGEKATRNATIAVLFAGSLFFLVVMCCCCAAVYFHRAHAAEQAVTSSEVRDNGIIVITMDSGAPLAITPKGAPHDVKAGQSGRYAKSSS